MFLKSRKYYHRSKQTKQKQHAPWIFRSKKYRLSTVQGNSCPSQVLSTSEVHGEDTISSASALFAPYRSHFKFYSLGTSRPPTGRRGFSRIDCGKVRFWYWPNDLVSCLRLLLANVACWKMWWLSLLKNWRDRMCGCVRSSTAGVQAVMTSERTPPMDKSNCLETQVAKESV